MGCYSCAQEIAVADEGKWVAFDLQKGYEKLHFCSAACLKSWMTTKLVWMCISLVIGLILTITMWGEWGSSAIILLFVPYSIRQLRHGLSGTGEIIPFVVVLLASVTVIYPLYKAIQEIREYVRIKNLVADI